MSKSPAIEYLIKRRQMENKYLSNLTNVIIFVIVMHAVFIIFVLFVNFHTICIPF